MIFIPKTARRMVGLMSGTSLDGVDAAIVDISGTSRNMDLSLRGFITRPYPSELRDLLLKNSSPHTSSVLEISQLNVRLAVEYAAAVQEVMKEAGLTFSEIDAVGCHGQTVYHVPEPVQCAGEPIRSTLQLGDPSTLANLLGVPVVGDFRLADMAVGGQGAPLAPYFDYVYFSDDDENRVLLNIGGIANLTALPRACSPDQVVAFDTGPGNMLIDALAQRFWKEPFDHEGKHASLGTVHDGLLDALLDDSYYYKPPPKSTGREVYDSAFVENLINLSAEFEIEKPETILATASALTVECIVRAYELFVRPRVEADRIIVSGGGVHNAWIMRELTKRFQPASVVSASEMGLDPDAKEAMFFAVLAHETLNGVPSNIPSATGARVPAILGKICPPSSSFEFRVSSFE